MTLSAGAALILGVGLVGASGVAAQEPPPNCHAPKYRQFDLCMGTWDAFDPAGHQVGQNTIPRELNGCVLREQWQSMRGPHRANGHDIYDRTGEVWDQAWVDGPAAPARRRQVKPENGAGGTDPSGERFGATRAQYLDTAGLRKRATVVGAIAGRRSNVNSGVRRRIRAPLSVRRQHWLFAIPARRW